MSDLKECKIIDSIKNIKCPEAIIQTPCGKFLIGIEYNSIYKYCLKTKQNNRIAGSVSVDQFGHQDGTRDEARFYFPKSLTLSKDLKTLFVSDTCNRVIRAICIVTGVTTTFVGQVGSNKQVDGSREKACFEHLIGLKLSPDGNTLIVADDSKLRSICIATGQVNTNLILQNEIYDYILSPDGKHIYICNFKKVLKYHLESGKSGIIFKGKDFVGCELSKDGQLLFISKMWDKEIKVVNLVTTEVIDTITTKFKPGKITVSTNGKQLHICYIFNNKIQVLDISKYCTNFKTFLQLQLAKHSFLSRAVVKRISI
jgi:DNA-binding beta-propeller fold protein YncE